MSHMGRQQANREILAKLSELVEKYPDLRFNQILCFADVNVTVVDPESEKTYVDDRYSEESTVTLARVAQMIEADK